MVWQMAPFSASAAYLELCDSLDKTGLKVGNLQTYTPIYSFDEIVPYLSQLRIGAVLAVFANSCIPALGYCQEDRNVLASSSPDRGSAERRRSASDK